jgi:AcrR family transcriptional regulator
MVKRSEPGAWSREYRMVKRAEQVAATRARILDAARAMLREGVLHDATFDELAARAGTTRVTVYRTFGSKAALLQAITWDELGRVRLDRLDAAHGRPDVRDAVRDVLFENCRMFAELGGTLPAMLELARRDDDIAAIIGATYHGRRHDAMKRLARRISTSGHAVAGWSTRQIVDALLVLTSYESFETLTERRGRSVQAAADELYALARAFVVDDR